MLIRLEDMLTILIVLKLVDLYHYNKKLERANYEISYAYIGIS